MATGEPPSYSGLVFRLAWANTWALLKDRTRDVIFGIPTMLIGAAIFLLLYGWAEMKHEVITFLAFVLAPGGLFLIFAFFWNLCLASDQLVYDAIKSLPLTPGLPAKPAVPAPKQKPPVNWSVWKAREKLSLADFAAILARNDPAAMGETTEQAAFLALLLEAANAGKFPIIPTYFESFGGRRTAREVDEDTEVEKKVAIDWADSKRFDVAHIK